MIKRKRIRIKAVCRGSYTVEAVFLFPMILFLIAFILQLSIALYGNVHQAAEDVEVLKQLDTGNLFLDVVQLKDIKELLLP